MTTKNDSKLHKLSLGVMLALGLAASPSLFAQELDDLLEESEEEVKEVVERVTVTGSRIRRQEFSTASPIQVINGDISRELGLFDTAELLQTTSQVSGLQIDSTFSGFVLDNGPGASTIGFRGLGAGRTLVLVNGRRIAPAGAGGAPVSPDLNLIPTVLIERVENLFDGASTTYGSDAIAGVSNAILRTDVDGFEFQGFYSNPESDGAEQTVLSGMYGTSGDDYRFQIAFEYNETRGQSFSENRFVSDCDEIIQEDRAGNIYSEYRGIGPSSSPATNCDLFPLSNRVSHLDFFGSLYYTPGSTNVGIPNFTETTTTLGNVPFIFGTVPGDSNGDGIDDIGVYDGNGDGLLDVNFQDPLYGLSISDYVNSSDWTRPLQRFSIFMDGDYLFNDDNDTRFFYEGLYARRDSDGFSAGAQIFEVVGVDNPFNPCGTDPINSVNCYGATGLDRFFGDTPSRMQPIISIRGDRDVEQADVYQYRMVAGLEGNIGALADFGQGNWFYEVSASYSASKGENSTNGLNEERLIFSLENSVRTADGSISCGDGCVPVNLFADSIYQIGGGNFATQAERDYLFLERSIETEVKQTLIGGFIGGDLLTLPWNDEIVPLIVGFEYRKDEIITNANDVAAEGLLWGFFSDRGADGDRDLKELYFETELPLLRGAAYAEELTITAAGRSTNETFYDTETVWSLKGVYRPNEWLTVRGTRGTSYRAPDLGNRFLNGTSGFNTVFDPCVVPDGARESDITGGPNAPETYVPEDDNREARVFTACAANGVDATSLGLRTATSDRVGAASSTEIITSGTEDLDPETSTSQTWGMIFEQPWSEEFELTLSFTNYEITINDAVATLTPGAILTLCYNNEDAPNGDSALCNLAPRDADGFLTDISRTPVNFDSQSSRGTDYNFFYRQAFVVGDNELDVTLDVLATKLKSQTSESFQTFDDNVGEPAFPEWRGNARLGLAYKDFRFNWITFYIGAGEPDNLGDFEDDNIACDGLVGISCRPVSYTGSYVRHNMSVSYSWDNMNVNVGMSNVFDRQPNKVGTRGNVFNVRNIPLGVGYDLTGREVFVNFGVSF